ncbi:MAG: ABC transporter ATP-binding protein [Chromatiales bacterium]|jgi:iron complex transport system ATP-binding protein
MTDATPVLECCGLDVAIGGIQVCRNFDWQVRANEVWGMLGINGIGKTTLLNTLAQLHPATAGNIHIDGKATRHYSHDAFARKLGMLFQQHLDDFPNSVLDSCLNGLHAHTARWKNLSEADLQQARAALKLVGLQGFEQRITNSLSGGERRRLDIATLILQNPKIWLLDEPLNHLDLHQQISMMQLLIDAARKQDGAVIAVMHDANLALRFCTHILLMPGDADIISGKATELLNEQQLQRLYRHPVIALHDQGKTAFIAG